MGIWWNMGTLPIFMAIFPVKCGRVFVMPRSARMVVAHVPYHITQWGNRQEDIFFTDDDRRAYLWAVSRL